MNHRSMIGLSLLICSAPLLADEAATRPAEISTPAGRIANDGTLNSAGRMMQPFAPNGPADYADVERPEPAMSYASCMLQIDGVRDVDGSTMDANALSSLLTTTLIREAAAGKALGFTREETVKFVSIRTQPLGERYVRLYAGLRKNLGKEFTPESAQKLLWEMCDQLRGSLQQSAQAKTELFAKAAADRDAKRQKLQTEIDELNKQITAATAASGEYGGGDNVQYQLNNIQQQRRSANQELTRLKRQLGDADPGNATGLVAQWQTLADARQKELNDLLAQQPVDADKVRAGTAKLTEALGAVATAKANGESNNARRNGFDVTQLKSQIAENEQRVAELDAQLKKLQDPKMADILNNLPTWQNRRNELRNQLNQLSSTGFNYGRQTGGGWVQITVLGATTQPVVAPMSQPSAND